MDYHSDTTGTKTNPIVEKGGTNKRSFLMEKPNTTSATESKAKSRKEDSLNKNRFGSVRKISGKVYVDFIYFGERVRESSGLPWDKENAKLVRKQLDRIGVKIQEGNFSFTKSFPQSKKKVFFTNKERQVLGRKVNPSDVNCGELLKQWSDSLLETGRIRESTYCNYEGHLRNYLLPFFGEMTLGDLNRAVMEDFVSWSRRLKLTGTSIRNRSINNMMKTVKVFCTYASDCYQWGNEFQPFRGFEKLPEDDLRDEIEPFSFAEQRKIINALPIFWQLFFLVAFGIGLRLGEQRALKVEDFNSEKRTLEVNKAFTRNAEGKEILGKTKNSYSERSIPLIAVMSDALLKQKAIHDELKSEFLFCNEKGKKVVRTTLCSKVWYPALKKAGVKRRILRQTRHSAATTGMSASENPLFLAKMLGHSNTNMLINVYSKYVENAIDIKDGSRLNAFLAESMCREE